MKVFLFFISIAAFLFNLNVSSVRMEYKEAVLSKEKTELLHNKLSVVTKSNNKVLVAYKGAVIALMAQYEKGVKNKKDKLKEGISLVEYAVESKPNDIEIRFVRLTIQQNIPKFLQYNKDRELDEQFVLENINSVQSNALMNYINDYILESGHFSRE